MTILLGDSIPLTPWLRQLLFMWARFARPNVERRGLGEPLGSPEEGRRIKKYNIYDLILTSFCFYPISNAFCFFIITPITR